MHNAGRRQDLREEELDRQELAQAEAEIELLNATQGDLAPGAKRVRMMPSAEHPARERVEVALRMGGYANYGGDWQCPACRCRVADGAADHHSDLSLRLELDHESVRLRCSHGCRENTIRAMLGMAAYVDDSPLPPTVKGHGSRH